MFSSTSAALVLGALCCTALAWMQDPAPLTAPAAEAAKPAAPLRVLVIDGRNNHAWRATTPVLRAILERAGCQVEVATVGEGEAALAAFRPELAKFQVVLSNYNGPTWSADLQRDLEGFVGGGGGLVVVHAADNAFPEWKAWNEMIGVGGWGDRNEKSGPYLRLREGRWIADPTPGPGGSHGAQHEFVLTHHASEHPILRGLPKRWKHTQDELYDRLRGPAQNVTVLASAFAPKELGGSGEEEPLLFALAWKKGRIFHSALGHSVIAMQCAGFQETLVRGVEWAATGAVRERATPQDFPSEEKSSARELEPAKGEVKK